jgi:hypothetical protein
MEVLTCYCNTELCNDNTFLKGRFGEWVARTMARLKAKDGTNCCVKGCGSGSGLDPGSGLGIRIQGQENEEK